MCENQYCAAITQQYINLHFITGKLPLFGIANNMHKSTFFLQMKIPCFPRFLRFVGSTWGIFLFHRFPLCFHTSHVHNCLKHFYRSFFPEWLINIFICLIIVPEELMPFTYLTNNIPASFTLWTPILTYHRIRWAFLFRTPIWTDEVLDCWHSIWTLINTKSS